MVLSNIRIIRNNNWSQLICDIESSAFGNCNIYFEIPVEYEDFFSTQTYDCFLVALLYPAMFYKEEIVIKGAVSKKLYKNINPYVQAVLTSYSEALSKITIAADSLIVPTQRNNVVATGFSAGVDSFSTFYEYFEKETDPEYRINTLFFFNVGSHGPFSDSRSYNKFIDRYEYLRNYTQTKNLPFIPLNSNVHFFHKEFGHERTVSLTLASAVLALETCLSRYYVSSGMSYLEMALSGKQSRNFDLAVYSETYLLPLLSTENCSLIPDGEQYLRSEKTELISDYAEAQKWLNVCIDNKSASVTNCSKCPKCLRTLMTLDSLNKLDSFADVFDLEVYKKYAFKYKCRQRVLYKKDPFAKDNVDFAFKHNKQLPSLFVAFIVCLPNMLYGVLKDLLKRIIGEKNSVKLKSFLRYK